MICCIADPAGLSEIEFVWLLGWNIADGQWACIGLGESGARKFLLELLSKLHGDLFDAAKQSRTRLQQLLMALHRGDFEETQQESPFSLYARHNMDALLRGWMEERERGFERLWQEIFQPGWEAARQRQNPIQITGETG